MLSPILTSKHQSHEPIYRHFVDKVADGRFESVHKEIQVLITDVVQRGLGCPIASSFMGIGSDITNGFVQFIVDSPVQFHDLNTYLVEIMDKFDYRDRPCINIRSKSLPTEFVTDEDKQFITVMFRTPKLYNRARAVEWWSTLAKHVQSYS